VAERKNGFLNMMVIGDNDSRLLVNSSVSLLSSSSKQESISLPNGADPSTL